MGITYRIQTTDADALDGVSPLPVNTLDRLVSLANGVQFLQLEAGEGFGRFDPSSLLNGPAGFYQVVSVCVLSDAMQTASNGVHAPGSHISLLGPENVGTRKLFDLGVDAGGCGVIPEGLSVPVPQGHQLMFDTTEDETVLGAPPGPHLIQIEVEPVTNPVIVPSLGAGAPQCMPPRITNSNPALPIAITAGGVAVDVTLTGVFLALGYIVILVRSDNHMLSVSNVQLVSQTTLEFTIDVTANPGDIGTYDLIVLNPNDLSCVARSTGAVDVSAP